MTRIAPSPRTLPILSLAALVLVASVALARDGSSAGGAASISATEILDHIKVLSDDAYEGRASGTPAGFKAAEYVAGFFKSYGLRPVGDDGGYFQAFEFSLGTRTTLGPANHLQAAGGRELEAGKDFSPLAFSGKADVTGPLVFAGYGIVSEDPPYDDYAGIDVKGKVVLVLRHSPNDDAEGTPWRQRARMLGAFTYKAARAEERGAAAILVVNDPRSDETGEDRLVTFERRMPGNPAEIPVAFVKRAVASEWLATAGIDLAAAQRSIDGNLKPVSADVPGVTIRVACEIVREDRGQGKAANVVGVVPGSDPELAGECIVVGAHYDHVGVGEFGSMGGDSGQIHNGADDNASGTSVLLELAQAFALSEERPRRSIVFAAFAAEERGLLGSRHYVEHPSVPIEKTAAMLNLDMVGRAEDGLVEVIGVGTSPGFGADLERWNSDVGLVLKKRDTYTQDSDHASFARREVPVLFFFTGLHPDYHRPGDDWEKINSDDASRIARLVHAGILDLANRKERPAFENPNRDGLAGRVFGRNRGGDGSPAAEPDSRLRPFLGLSASDSVDGSPGVLVTEVADGGPAALAGLKAGDVVLSVGGKKMTTREDLRAALEARRPGDTLELEVVRKWKVEVGGRP